MWSALMEGTSLDHLATMGVMDIEQFAMRFGYLQFEAKKGRWQQVYAILWRDPAVAVDATREMALLLYPDDQAHAPLMVLQLNCGEFTVTPPKTMRKLAPWSHCFRVDQLSSKTKVIMAAETSAEYTAWLSMLQLDDEAKNRLRTGVTRQDRLAEQSSRAKSQEEGAHSHRPCASARVLRSLTHQRVHGCWALRAPGTNTANERRRGRAGLEGGVFPCPARCDCDEGRMGAARAQGKKEHGSHF